MAQLVCGVATSHAFALMEPDLWDNFRAGNRQAYARKYGQAPPEHPIETDRSRYQSIRDALDKVRDRLARADVDSLVLIGDDQDENFVDEIPQFGVYLGDEFIAAGKSYRGQPDLARLIHRRGVDDGFDLTGYKRFRDGALRAHAFAPVLARIAPEASVVPVFVESIHVPAPSPKRCWELGRSLRSAVEAWQGGRRVAVCASGGLSHFSAGYPYRELDVPGYGSICEAFDRQLIQKLTSARACELAELSNADLLLHGEVGFRSWLVLLGMVGDIPAQMLAYEPFYAAIMGMGVASWDL